jgi:hypothetical protein
MQRLVRGEIFIFRALSPSRPLALSPSCWRWPEHWVAGSTHGWIAVGLFRRKIGLTEHKDAGVLAPARALR